MLLNTETIAALATPPGKGGIGIVRISGPATQTIASKLTGKQLQPRYAHYGNFFESSETGEQRVIDSGIAIFFNNPHSFTGEDVLELQAHGGPVLLDCLLKEVLKQGARLARPGEFSERAFLNNKIDLTQAEAIADLIDSASEHAAKNAVRSLQGVFSEKIKSLVNRVIALRMYVEAAIDFPEEEIDFLADGKALEDLGKIIENLQQVFTEAKQGTIISEGMNVVIAGKPNAGKSSLLNALSGRDSAIVTDIEGTTRDVLRELIQIDGMPLHIIDTAGLRDSADQIEQEGIRRAWSEIDKADQILYVVDSQNSQETDLSVLWPAFVEKLPAHHNVTIIHNKCDLSGLDATLIEGDPTIIRVSARHTKGINLLREHLKNCMGYKGGEEGGFTARRRHLVALEQAMAFLVAGKEQLIHQGAGELLAEDLRQCQNALNEITGEFTPDDLLGKIFSSFCIGK